MWITPAISMSQSHWSLEEKNIPSHEQKQEFSHCLDYKPSQKLAVFCVCVVCVPSDTKSTIDYGG